MWDLIVSVPDHCLSFYFTIPVYLLYHNLEANVLKCDKFPFTFYPYNKIMMKTTDKTKHWTKPRNFGEGKIFKKLLQHYMIDYIVL